MGEREIELKLTLDAAETDRFRRDPAIHRAKRGRASSKAMLAVYFDTPSLALRSAKAALRIRQEGRNRIQTLKLSQGGTGLQRREEFNAPCGAATPDLSLIDDTAARENLNAWIGGEELVPVFSTEIRRTIWMLDLEGATVELVLDIGRVRSGDHETSVLELEFELKAGDPLPLLDFARDLANRYGLHVEERSKAARGYALFLDETPKPRKAAKLTLDPEAASWKTLGKIVEECGAQLFANEGAVRRGGDIEGVHQARVAVRRTRAALSAFRAIVPDAIRKSLNKRLRRHQVMLGPARDWDVFLEDVLVPLQESGGGRKMSKFLARAEVARKLAYARAHKEMGAARYGRLQLDLVRFPYLPMPLEGRAATRDLAARLLDERLETVLYAAAGNPCMLEEMALHDFRIDVKKLRYGIDFFRSMYAKENVSAWRSVCKKLQDCLGGLNDAAVQGAMLDAMDAPDRPVPSSVRRAILTFNARRVDDGLSRLDASWRDFALLSPFWR